VPGEAQELTYDPKKRSAGGRLVPLPYLLFLASFNSDKKNSEAPALLPEGNACRKQIKFNIAGEQERLAFLCYQFLL